MRKNYSFFSILLLSFLSFSISAQNVYTGLDANNIINGTELIRTSKFGEVPSFIKYRQGQQPTVQAYLQNLRNTLKLEQNLSLVLDSQEEDNLGFVHYRYHQVYNGVPLEFSAWYVHTKNGKVISANGFLHRSLPNPKPAQISKAQSIQYATNYIGATTYKWQIQGEEAHLKIEQENPEATYYPQPELVYIPKGYDLSSDMYRIAYKMNVYAQAPLSRNIIYVDAVSGEILNSIEQIHVVDAVGTAVTGYSGSQTITSDQVSASNYRLRETGRGNGVETYNMQQGTSYGSAVDFTDTDNTWNNVNAQFDQYATDAHWGAEMTYDYLLNQHGRNSIDNAGFKLVSYVHYDQGYNNAFWDGARMTYGDGNGNPLTSIDISAHEIAHGLNSNTANLIYNAESGALNESFSDIFGAAVERYGRPTNWNWTMGEDLGSPFRSMSNPTAFGDPDTYMGTNWASLTGADNGGVHTNSSIQNYWFHLLSDGGSGTNDNGDVFNLAGIGFDDAEDVAFRNLTIYLTPSSNFADARFLSIQAAVDLFGACTSKVGAVTDTWYAVGVGSAYVPYTKADFSSGTTSSCVTPFTVNFSNGSVNASTYTWNFGDGTTSNQMNPTHTYNSYGAYTVVLSANGGVCGIDDTTKVNYIMVSDTLPCIVSMPAIGVGSIQTGCSGYLYDSGGPNGNYGANENSVITISPTGASSVTLYVNSFDIEPGTSGSCNYDDLKVYDGPNTSSPLLGEYCNNNVLSTFTSSTGSITITFSSDGGLEKDGFELEWVCNSDNAAPIARFSNDVLSSCTGDVSFTDESNNSPTTWNWNFGDGQTSSIQNPTHHYNSSGIFTVTLTASNGFGSDSDIKTDVIEVNLETPPTTTNDTTCIGAADTLMAISSGIHNWFTNPNTGVSIATGDTFITPPLSVTTTYYVDQKTTSVADTVGPLDNNFGGGGNFNGDHHLVFEVTKTLILESVFVYATGSGSRTIELRDAGGSVLQSISLALSDGPQRINLNFTISPGTGYQLGVAPGSQPNLFRNNSGASYPYIATNLMRITGSSASAGYYYYFYDWYIRDTECKSDRVPVVAEVISCLPSGINNMDNNWSVSLFPNPATNEVTISLANSLNLDDSQIQLVNTVGQVILTKRVQASNTILDISTLAKGVYYVRINIGQSIKIEKLVIQ